jgi:hypothetical protein
VSKDGWKINGCPHVDAAMATLGNKLYITAFSEAQGKPAIYLASSSDGETFTPKRAVSLGTTDPTHPFLTASEDRLGVVFQARDSEKEGWGKMQVYYREVSPDGTVSPLMRAGTGPSGASFPSAALGLSGRTFVGWTQTGEDGSKALFVRGRRTTP